MGMSLDRSALEALRKPVAEARGLPNAAFVDPDFHELEKQTVFSKSWVFAGRKSEVPKQGDIRLVEIAGEPLIIVRGRDGAVRVFYNVCPHRGARLVTEDRRGTRIITCKYHAWAYDLAGRLRTRPHFNGPGLHDEDAGSTECVSLFEVRTDFWHDGVFVNLDGKAPPLPEYLAPLDRQAEGFDISQFAYADTVSGRFNCNWKLAVENWSDVYHVFAVHPGLNQMMDQGQRTGADGDGNLIYFRWRYDEEFLSRDPLPRVQGLEGPARTLAFNGHLYPGLAISFHPTMFLFWDFKPVGHDRTRLDLHIYYVASAAHDPDHAATREGKAKYYTGLNAEDEEVCRLMQEGRQARGYDGGRFSPFWDRGTLHFANLVAQSIT